MGGASCVTRQHPQRDDLMWGARVGGGTGPSGTPLITFPAPTKHPLERVHVSQSKNGLEISSLIAVHGVNTPVSMVSTVEETLDPEPWVLG